MTERRRAVPINDCGGMVRTDGSLGPRTRRRRVENLVGSQLALDLCAMPMPDGPAWMDYAAGSMPPMSGYWEMRHKHADAREGYIGVLFYEPIRGLWTFPSGRVMNGKDFRNHQWRGRLEPAPQGYDFPLRDAHGRAVRLPS